MSEQFVAEVDAAVSVNTGEPNVSAFSSGNEGRIEEIKISNVGHFLIGPSPAANLVGYYRKDRTNPSAFKKPGTFSSRLFFLDGQTAALPLKYCQAKKKIKAEAHGCVKTKELIFILFHFGKTVGAVFPFFVCCS